MDDRLTGSGWTRHHKEANVFERTTAKLVNGSAAVFMGLAGLALLVILASGVGLSTIERPADAGSSNSAASSIRQEPAAVESTRLGRSATEYVNPFGSTAWVRAWRPPLAARMGAARMSRQAGKFVNLYGSSAWVRGPRLTVAQSTEAQRLQAMTDKSFNRHGSSAWVRSPGPTPSRGVESARLRAQAGEFINQFGSSARISAAGLSRGHVAEAARLTARAIGYDRHPDPLSPDIAQQLP